MDFGREAFFDTLDALKKNKIPVIGAGRNIGEAVGGGGRRRQRQGQRGADGTRQVVH
jgi:hypothetical protein